MNNNLNNYEKWLLSLILDGRMEARTASKLSEMMPMDTTSKEVQECIHNLRKKGYLIGSVSNAPRGYFMITDANELATVTGELENRGNNTLKVSAILKELWGKRHDKDQIRQEA